MGTYGIQKKKKTKIESHEMVRWLFDISNLIITFLNNNKTFEAQYILDQLLRKCFAKVKRGFELVIHKTYNSIKSDFNNNCEVKFSLKI